MLKRYFSTLILLITLFSNLSIAQESNFYEKSWKVIDSLKKNRLPKSVYAQAEKIYVKAKKEKQYIDQIKALSVKYNYVNIINKNGQLNFLKNTDKELKGMPFPYDAIMHSFIADKFYEYFSRNKYKIGRVEINESNDENIESWDSKDFINKIDYHFKQSLKESNDYRKLNIEDYKRIFHSLDTEIKDLNLYELLAHNALEFYFSESWALNDYKFVITRDYFFKPAREFKDIDISEYKGDILKYRGLTVLKQLANYIIKIRSKEVLVRNELYRYNLIISKYVGKNDNILYIDALKDLEKKHKNGEVANVYFAHAQYLFNKSYGVMSCTGEEKNYKYRKTAKEVCNKCISEYKGSNAAKLCKNLIINIDAKHVDIKSERIIPSKSTFPVMVNYRNTDTIWLRVWKPLKAFDSGKYMYSDKSELLKNSKLIRTQKFILNGGNDHNLHSTEVLAKGLDYGIYLIEVSAEKAHPSKKYSLGILTVSDLQYMKRSRDSIAEIRILNRKTGKPLEGVKVSYWREKWTRGKTKKIPLGEKISDSNGLVTLKGSGDNISFRLYKGRDTLESGYLYVPIDREVKEIPQVEIFSDRKIYRPGDKVYFKAIMYSGKDNSYSVLSNRYIKLEFLDANYQKISEKKLKTNEYGSVGGSFDLPYNMLTGNCTIKSDYRGYHRIRVEEYKAPKVEVKSEKPDKEYKYNEEVVVKAQALTFNNVPVSDAKFEYKVYRNKYDIWRPYFFHRSMGKPLFTGKGTTDKEGKLSFSFVAKPFDATEENVATMFTYEIAVTDINGETQKVTDDLKISSQSLYINSKLKDIFSLKELKEGISFTSKNINGKDIPAELKVELIKLKGLSSPLADRLWEKPTCPIYNKEEWKKLYPGHVYADENIIDNYKQEAPVGTYSLNTKDSKILTILGKAELLPGCYMLKATAKDKDAKEVTYKKSFILYNPASQINPDSKYLWADCSHNKAQPGDKITFTFGSSKAVTVLYEIISNNKVVGSEQIQLNNEQRKINIKINETHRGGVSIVVYSLYNNRIYKEEKNIDIPYSNKKLNISFTSFRDKLLPGEKESWTLKIKDWKDKPANAEMLATLYDASLDKLSRNNWSFNPYAKYFYGPNWNYSGYNVQNWRYVDKVKYDFYKNIRTLSNDFFWRRSMGNGLYIRGISSLKYGSREGLQEVMVTGFGAKRKNSGVELKMKEEMEIADEEYGEEIIPITRQGIVTPPPPLVSGELQIFDDVQQEVQIRKDFASTAFFYPFLRTDENGDIEIKFTVPESLTRWKMMGLTHTKDLSIGIINKYLETKKDLMVNSNAPRFLREGDKIEFTTKLSNLSDKELKGGVKIELQNAITGEYLDIIDGDAIKVFTVAKKSNSVVSWTINVPENIGILKYTVVAKNGDYSDGESSVIPVLSRRIMVTKSMPFSVNSPGESTLIVPDLKNILKDKSIEPYRMTMEFSSNPVWYAVQSLPYLMEYPYECCEQTFSRYFANNLASYIIQSNPKIKEIYDVWKSTASSDKETFMSKLEKNKELKQVVIEETPWLAEAKSQEERIKRLGMLFDLNNMSREKNRTIMKLKDNQNSDGGWPWFKDMRSDRFITQHILAGLGYLSKITGENNKEYFTQRALRWAKDEFVESYIKRHKKDTVDRPLSFMDLHFLYMATFYKDMKFTQEEKLIVDFYLNKSKQYWKDASLYNKGLTALVLYRNGRTVEAKGIVASLKEYAINDSYYGMYWKENIGGLYVHKAQIEIQALMIEVFSEITNDKKSVDDMKMWLLNHKRTNSWESTKATVCAIYSLLSGKDDNFDMDATLEVTVGKKVVFDATKSENIIEAGTGYVKKVFQKSEISKDMDIVKIRKFDDKLMWGALYLQYFNDIDKVMESSSGLEIKKQVLVERILDGKISYEKVNKDTRLEVGDKLKVNLKINNEFPMEYVHIKDLRASCLEPGFVKSGHSYKNRLSYYISVKDASVNYFIDYLPQGEFSLSYELRVTHKGSFSDGISTIQCMYAPEYQANSKGKRLKVGE